MATHLKRHATEYGGDTNHFIIRIDSNPKTPFWMYVQVSAEVTFGVLDKFLRAVWLECCGHLSKFTVNGRPAGKRRRLNALLSEGMSFSYRYDMGSTTELSLAVVGRTARIMPMRGWYPEDAYCPPDPVMGEGKVYIMALHEKVRYNCEKCGGEASYVCSLCIYEGTGALCKVCAPSHKCGSDMLLAAAQSPRVGTYGFGGGSLR